MAVIDNKQKMMNGGSVACDWYPIAIHNIYFGTRLPIGHYTRISIDTQ